MAKRILVVDDDPGVLQAVGRIVEFLGHEAEVATSPSEALNMLEHSRFDIALVDIQLPSMNGLELAQRIQQVVPGTPVVLMTGALPDQCLEGAIVLLKPFSIQELRHCIEDCL